MTALVPVPVIPLYSCEAYPWGMRMAWGLWQFGIWSLVWMKIVQFQERKRGKGGPLSSFRDAKMVDFHPNPLRGAADFGAECVGTGLWRTTPPHPPLLFRTKIRHAPRPKP